VLVLNPSRLILLEDHHESFEELFFNAHKDFVRGVALLVIEELLATRTKHIGVEVVFNVCYQWSAASEHLIISQCIQAYLELLFDSGRYWPGLEFKYALLIEFEKELISRS
jgi:hypothetical protein